MLNFAIYDANTNDLHKLSDMLESIFIENNLEAQTCFKTSSSTDLLDYIKENQVDVFILDTSLNSKLNGLDLAKIIREQNKDCYIVFTSESLDFVLLAYKHKTFDYLCKPIHKNTLQETVLRLFEDIKSNTTNNKYIKLDNKNTLINGSIVQYIKRDGMKVIFHTDTKNYSIYSSFNKLQPQLPKNFVRCHKSFIANINNICNLDSKSNLIYFKNNETCDIGPKYKKNFLKEVKFYEQ